MSLPLAGAGASVLSAREARTLSRILRVNHAGEAGAIRIYQAQIALARWTAPDLVGFLKETLAHEQAHMRRFRQLMPERGVRPCGALPLWGLGGLLLGGVTALFGRPGVLICTAAVERTVHRHMRDQIGWLAGRDDETRAMVAEIMAEELQHLDFAQTRIPAGGGRAGRWLDGAVAVATDLLIWLSTYGASAGMARDLRDD